MINLVKVLLYLCQALKNYFSPPLEEDNSLKERSNVELKTGASWSNGVTNTFKQQKAFDNALKETLNTFWRIVGWVTMSTVNINISNF